LRYWDTSAIVPLLLEERGSALARAWLEDDPQIVTWALTRLEIAATVERLARDGVISAGERRRIHEAFERFSAMWAEVTDILATRSRAMALLARQVLHSADAAQLGAAWLAAEGDPTALEFVCFDRALAGAAEREGFRVLTWPAT
jgi:uncharacterized protein with PIN domain